MIKLLKKYKEIILYLVFGVLTTLVNIVVFGLFAKVLFIDNYISNGVAWFISVLFAYLTNRKYVFNSKASTIKDKTKETINFFMYRFFSLFIDMGIMYVMIDLLLINNMVSKITANIVVIIANYVFSKFLVFKKNCND